MESRPQDCRLGLSLKKGAHGCHLLQLPGRLPERAWLMLLLAVFACALGGEVFPICRHCHSPLL
jgi:hypothetical protein